MANSFIKPGQCLTGSLPSSPIEHPLKPEPALPENSAQITSVHNLNVAQEPSSDDSASQAGSAAALLELAYQIRASLAAKPEHRVQCCLPFPPVVHHSPALPDQAPQDKMGQARSQEADRSSKADATDGKQGTAPLKVGQFLEPLSQSASLHAPTGHSPQRVLEEICGIQLGPIHDAPAGTARKKAAKATGYRAATGRGSSTLFESTVASRAKAVASSNETAKGTGPAAAPAASKPAGKKPAADSGSSTLFNPTVASNERAVAIREEKAKAAAPAASHPAGKQPAPIDPLSRLLQSTEASDAKAVQGTAHKARTADALASCSKQPAKAPAKPAWR